MRWSQHRKLLRDHICPDLQKRVDFHVTRYRHAHDKMGEAWITVDGERVLSAGYCKWWKAYHEADKQIKETPAAQLVPCIQQDHYFTHRFTVYPITEKYVHDQGVYETGYFIRSFAEYLNLPIERALSSENPLIRGLAMLDDRLGKRRFGAIILTEADPVFVRQMHALRETCMKQPRRAQSEGLPPVPASSQPLNR